MAKRDRNNNKQNRCKNCDHVFSGSGTTFCNKDCDYGYRQKKKDEEIYQDLVSHRPTLRKFLLRLNGNQCVVCENTTWTGDPIPLALDHRNGNAGDNSLENLRMICHNCHAQTPFYKAKNKGFGRAARGLKL